MNAVPHIVAATPSVSDSAEPFYFASDGRRLFGWLNRPAAHAAGDLGVVICQPFGYEALCGHRSIRSFAEQIASAEVPCLRFDYAGTGDSSDLDAAADQVQAWSQNIADAIGALRDRTGARRICLLGFRLGALLATIATARCEAVQSLILVAPTLNGRRYVRELKTTRMAALLGADSAAWAGTQDGTRISGSDVMEFSGYPMSKATMDALGQFDAGKDLAPLAARSVCVLDRSDLPSAQGFAERLTQLGAQVEYTALPGFVEMMMTAPQFAVVPKRMVDLARAWISKISAAPQPHSAVDDSVRPRGVPVDDQDCASVSLPTEKPGAQAGLCERPVFLENDVRLFGIVTEPPQGEVRRRAVILLNVGADYHIGASRMYVTLARTWAQRGYVVLRLDLAGLGDSATRSGRADNEVFPVEAVADIGMAMEFIRKRYGIRDTALLGMCSGAYHALRAAVAGLPVTRILMVNPQNFFWKTGDSLEGLQLAEVVRNPRIYKERAFSLQAWRRLLSGQVNLWRIAKIYWYRPLLAIGTSLRNISRTLGIRLPQDLGRELEELGARGVRIVFVFSEGEPGVELLKIQGGSAVSRLGNRCLVHIIDSADHTFSRSEPRMVLQDVLSRELLVRDEFCQRIGAAELVGR